MSSSNPSRVWEAAPLAPAQAHAHFTARLALETDASDLHKDLRAGVPRLVLVDARKPEAYAQGHIPGALNLPHGSMDAASTAAWARDALYVVYCWNSGCNASLKAAHKLSGLGFQVKELMDGLRGWETDGFALAQGLKPGSLQP